MIRYPTRNNLPIPAEELDLAPSRMNPEREKNWSFHHRHFNSGWYKQDFIFNSLRNLEGEQDTLLRDQHNLGKLALHSLYDPPERPTYRTAMDRLEEAIETGEYFRIWNIKKKCYETIPFDRMCWNALKKYYKAQNDFVSMAAD